MTSILSRLLTADKPWTVPYMVPTQRASYVATPSAITSNNNNSQMLYQHNVVSGNDFPPVQPPAGRRKKTSRKSQDTPVRFGRVPKREKAKILAAMQKVNANSHEKALTQELEDEYRIMSVIIQAHDETCNYTKAKVVELVEKARAQPVYLHPAPQLACPLNPVQHIKNDTDMDDFSEQFAPAIRGVVEFTKKIPGFGLLSQDDQVTLLKAGVFEVLLVRLSCLFDSSSNTLICLNGQVLRRESLHSSSNARFLLDSMFDFAERMNNLHLTDCEVGLFCAVVIISADRPGLRNKELVLKVQKKMIDILQKTVANNHPEDPIMFNELMKKIPDLRTLNTLHSEKLFAFGKMEPCNQSAAVLESMADTSVNLSDIYDVSAIIPHDMWNQYALSSHPPCLAPEDLRSTSPGQHSQHSGSGSTGSEWSTTDSKDEHDIVGSPRSISSGICPEEAKSPLRSSSSFSASRGYHSEEAWPTESNHNVEYHHALPMKRPAENPGSEHGSSSGDESYYVGSPIKAAMYPNLRRVDSPTDSGIESGKEHGPSNSPTMCQSPRSSVDDKVKDMDVDHHNSHEKHDTIEDMPVLKRALQAPPIIQPHTLMDEAYRSHKKFRVAERRREAESPSSPSQLSLASTHSTLARTLEQAPRYLSEQQLKRTDLIHNIIMQKETLPGQQIPHHHQKTLSQTHHIETQPLTCPVQNNSYPYNSVSNSSVSPSASTFVTSNAQTHKSNLLLYQNGYGGNVQQQTSIYTSTAPSSWAYGQQQSPSVVSAPVQLHAQQYEPSHMQQQQSSPNTIHHQNSSNFSSNPVINSSRSGSPRIMYNPHRSSPSSSTSPLVMNGIGHCPSSAQSSSGGSPRISSPVQSEVSIKNSGESFSQPLNLSKKIFSPPMLKMES